MPRRDIVVIGASAGGLQALTTVVRQLPDDFNACILIVVHSNSNGASLLPDILSRTTSLPVAFGKTGDRVEPGRIYVAPPDCHLLVSSNACWCSTGRARMDSGRRSIPCSAPRRAITAGGSSAWCSPVPSATEPTD